MMMEESKILTIYLADLGHYTIRLQNNHTPINIGFIAAYTQEKCGKNVRIRLFKDPDKLIAAIASQAPDILGVSNYVWNDSISQHVMKSYKKKYAKGITISGGPNFPMNEQHKAEQYLRERPYLDFYIPFEGEQPFANIADAVLRHGAECAKTKSARAKCFKGTFFIGEDDRFHAQDIGVHVADMNELPSPYLGGWMDEFLKEGLYPMFETRRGCPFQCAFCHTGLPGYNQTRAFPLARLKAEIEHIIKTVPDPTKAHLYITDTNLGMWEQDLEFMQYLNKRYEETGFPLSLGTSTGKGREDLVLKTVMSHPKLMLTNSVQTLDEKVLKEIKRKNLSMDILMQSQEDIEAAGKLSQPEIIVGLPTETKESHLNTLRKLVGEIGADIIYQYTLMLLPGTGLSTDESRRKYQYLTKYRLIPTAFGEYQGDKCFEIEEVSVGTKDMSFDEYLEMREMFFLVHNIVSNIVYRPLIRYLRALNIDIIEFFLYLSKNHQQQADGFAHSVIRDYLADTQGELFDSKEELIRYYSQEKNYQDLLNGVKGVNLTHTYRTIVMLHTKEWAEFITGSFLDYLGERFSKETDEMALAQSICEHINAQAECQYRFFKERGKIPTKEKPLSVALTYDVPTIFKMKNIRWDRIKMEKGTWEYVYYMRDDAVKYISSFPEEQKMVDLALIVLRMDRRYPFPEFKEKKQFSAVS